MIYISGNSTLRDAALALFCYAVFYVSEVCASMVVPAVLERLSFPSLWSFDIALSAAYVVLCPSKLLLGILPALHFMLFLTPHGLLPANVNRLDGLLQRHGIELLDRQQSNTGYISVLESTRYHYRVMRCDHSLLGGNWLSTGARRRDGIIVPEPIYPVFTMLEAVRLMRPNDDDETSPGGSKAALVVYVARL